MATEDETAGYGTNLCSVWGLAFFLTVYRQTPIAPLSFSSRENTLQKTPYYVVFRFIATLGTPLQIAVEKL